MKTKNNVQKTVFSASVVIISLVLISFTVTAQDFWKMVITSHNSNQNALALADMHKQPKNQATNTETWVEKMTIVDEAEQELQIENWMKESSKFDSHQVTIEPATENSLKVEEWMLDEIRFGTGTQNDLPMILEPWMYNETLWMR